MNDISRLHQHNNDINNKQNTTQNLGKNITNEQEIYQKELKDNK